MAITFKRTRTQMLVQTVDGLRRRALDALYSPVISRLTDEEYFSCRTRNDCVRAYLRRKLG